MTLMNMAGTCYHGYHVMHLPCGKDQRVCSSQHFETVPIHSKATLLVTPTSFFFSFMSVIFDVQVPLTHEYRLFFPVCRLYLITE